MQKINLHSLPKNQYGAALAVSLIMLIVLALLGTAGIRSSILEEKMSANMRDSEISFQAAEAALTEGENWILALEAEPLPVTGCGTSNCVLTYDPSRYLQDNNSTWWDGNSNQLDGSLLIGTTTHPQYIIEYLRFVSDGSVQIGAGVPQGKHYYRVTTRATGASAQAVTILRSTVARRF